MQQVTIGYSRNKQGGGCPKIGDNVFIGCGAIVIGNIKIGNNVIIGANSLVIRDIPDNAIVGGVPAQILNYKGEEEIKHWISPIV